ncbi:uncharacterized protein LOC111042618 isoform X2 [Myzus persicae]|nr:uncharacterized protein LOC111042618 isoform X2 [Myzus persicae]
MSNYSKPITPEYGGKEFFRILENIPAEERPNAHQFRMPQENEPVSSAMTLAEDTDCRTNTIQLTPVNWHKVYSTPIRRATDPIHANSPEIFPPTPLPKAPRSPLRVRVDLFPDMGEWGDKWRSSSLISSSMIAPPRNRDKYRQQIHDISRATSPPDVLYDRAQYTPISEHNILIIGDILNIAPHSEDNQPDELVWWNDG